MPYSRLRAYDRKLDAHIAVIEAVSVLLDQVEQFWVSNNEIKGRRFKVIGRADATIAAKLIKTATKR